jgi:hypothetical protein
MPGAGDFPAKNVPFPLLFSHCAHTLMQLSQCSLSYAYHCMMLYLFATSISKSRARQHVLLLLMLPVMTSKTHLPFSAAQNSYIS